MDIQLHFDKLGSGKPLILLHGNGENSSYFKNQINFFKNKFTVYAVDTRGHGKSPRGVKSFTIKQFADDLKDFTDVNEIDKAVVLGFSDGANIAMEFALKYPEKVEKLILNGGNATTKGVKAKYQIQIEAGYIITKVFSLVSPDAKKKHEFLSLMVGQPNLTRKNLQSIKCPTLVIAGDNDMIKTSHTRFIAESIPNSCLAIIEGDHFIAAKRSEEFNSIIEKFLNA